jgi:glutamyl-tRNA reductase
MPMTKPDQLWMVGVSHQRASLELLERLALRRDEAPDLLERLQALGAAEAVVLSTCSRVELYVGPGVEVDDLLGVLAERAGRPLTHLRRKAEVLTGPAVAEHLLRVTAGLESRVVGEVDIQDQVRAAYRAARAAGTVGLQLGRLFPLALRCGVQVRSRTSLGRRGRSLARRAVDIGVESMPGSQLEALVVGSGQMAAVATERLAALGHPFRVAARDEAYAARLAGPGRVCRLSSLADGIARCDLLICATSATQHVVTVEHVRAAMSLRSRPLTVVDLAVPRNVDTAVREIAGVLLVDLSGLNDDAAGDPAVQAAVDAAGTMVVAAARGYLEDVAARGVGQLIEAVRSRVEQVSREELARRMGPVPPELLARAAHGVAGRLLHQVTLTARSAAAAGDTAGLVLICEAFGLHPEEVGLTAPLDAAQAG